jgi:hypothetical protein
MYSVNIYFDLKVMQSNFTTSMWIFRTWTYAVLALRTSEKNIRFYIFILSNTKPVDHTFAIIFYTIILCDISDVEHFSQNLWLYFFHDMLSCLP